MTTYLSRFSKPITGDVDSLHQLNRGPHRTCYLTGINQLVANMRTHCSLMVQCIYFDSSQQTLYQFKFLEYVIVSGHAHDVAF